MYTAEILAKIFVRVFHHNIFGEAWMFLEVILRGVYPERSRRAQNDITASPP